MLSYSQSATARNLSDKLLALASKADRNAQIEGGEPLYIGRAQTLLALSGALETLANAAPGSAGSKPVQEAAQLLLDNGPLLTATYDDEVRVPFWHFMKNAETAIKSLAGQHTPVAPGR